jgi:hypothetical protein
MVLFSCGVICFWIMREEPGKQAPPPPCERDVENQKANDAGTHQMKTMHTVTLDDSEEPK